MSQCLTWRFRRALGPGPGAHATQLHATSSPWGGEALLGLARRVQPQREQAMLMRVQEQRPRLLELLRDCCSAGGLRLLIRPAISQRR